MSIDWSVYLWNKSHHPVVLEPLMRRLSSIFDIRGEMILAVLFAFYFLWRHRIREACVLVSGSVIAFFITLCCKNIFHRTRPPGSFVHTYSFPSGHALGAIVFGGLLTWAFIRQDPKHHHFYRAVGVVFILVMGFDRLFLGVHWFSDVLGGYGIGALFVASWISLLGKKR